MRKVYFWSIMLQYSNWDGGIGGTCNRVTTSAFGPNGPILCSAFPTALSVFVVLYGVFAWNSKDFVNENYEKKNIIIILYR